MIWHIHLFMDLAFSFSPPPILDSVFPVYLFLSSRRSSCMQLSWQPCRYRRGPSTAPFPSPTWQQEHTRLPAARVRRAGAAHHPRPRYDLGSHVLLCVLLGMSLPVLCYPLYIRINRNVFVSWWKMTSFFSSISRQYIFLNKTCTPSNMLCFL